jgi:hypothetical protein
MKHTVCTEKVRRGSLLRRGTPCLPPLESDRGNLGFEAEPFKTADKLRCDMEPSDYKQVAPGFIVLKKEAKRAERFAAEDPDEHPADNAFWAPAEAQRLPCSTS